MPGERLIEGEEMILDADSGCRSWLLLRWREDGVYGLIRGWFFFWGSYGWREEPCALAISTSKNRSLDRARGGVMLAL